MDDASRAQCRRCRKVVSCHPPQFIGFHGRSFEVSNLSSFLLVECGVGQGTERWKFQSEADVAWLRLQGLLNEKSSCLLTEQNARQKPKITGA